MRVISAACLAVVCGLFISVGSVSAGVPDGGACPTDPAGTCQDISSCTGFVNIDSGCDSGDCCTGGGAAVTAGGGGGALCPMGTAMENGICIPTATGLSRGDTTTNSITIGFLTISIQSICMLGPIACVLATFMNWSLSIVGFIAIISFVLAGFQYLLAFGDPKSMEKAKSHVRWSIIGVIVALSGMVVIYAVDGLLAGYSKF